MALALPVFSGALTSVTMPNAMQTVYTYGQDTTSQTATVRIQEVAGEARDLTYHLTNDYITLGTNVISQPTGIHRLIKNPAAQVEWMLIPHSDPNVGQVTRKRSRTGDVELFTHDSKGNLLTHSTGLKEVGGTDQQTAAYSQVTKEYYPATGANAGMLKTEKSALYNASTPTLYRTDYEYDTSNRITKKIDPATTSGQARPETTYDYDAAGRLVEVIDPLNRVTTFAYDSAGRQTQVTYPDTSTEQTLYGTGANAGRVVATKNRVGTVTTYSYDTSGRLTQTIVGAAIDANILDGNAYDTTVTDPNLKQTTEYTYLAGSDSIKAQVKNNGAVTDYTIDFKNRVTEVKQYPRVGTTLTSKKSYLENQLLYDEDAYGRRKYYGYRASDGTLIRTVTCTHPGYTLADFDAVWSLTRSTAANAAYIIHDAIRDDAGHLTQVIDGRGTETRYEYDAQGRVTKKTAAWGTSVAAVTETDYDADGRVVEVRSPRYFDSSDTEGYQKAKENWTYNGRGFVATHTEAAGSSVAATESFTYFADGRQQTHTDYRGKVWTNIDDTCCGKSTASKNPLGHGSIRNTDPQRRAWHWRRKRQLGGTGFASVLPGMIDDDRTR